MAEPVDGAAILEDVIALAQTQYRIDCIAEYPQYFGSTTNKLFKPAAQPVVGTGVTLQVKHRRADNVRFGNLLSDPTSPDVLGATTIQARLNRQTPASNDFTQVTASVRTDLIDLQMKGKGSIIDFVQEVYGSIMGQYDEILAIHRHLPRSGVMALVNGTPKQNNAYTFSGASATPTNTTGMRVPIDAGSIAVFAPGRRVDFIRPATGAVIAGNIEVTDQNLDDGSVGFQFNGATSVTARQSTGLLGSVADNDYIVLSGCYNLNLYSIGAYFSTPTASESFVGGVDRTTSGYRWMIPYRSRDGATSAKITKSMFNTVAVNMGYREEMNTDGSPASAVAFISDPTLHQAIRDEIGEQAFIQIPVDDTRAKRFANFGDVGLNYQHGQFGLVKIMSDPLAPPNTVRILSPDTWKSYYVNQNGLRPVTEGNGTHWYRLSAQVPNTGKGLFYQCDWMGVLMDWCDQPWKNSAILNVTAT